ncbi:MAG: hypothetical protein H3Z53_11465 [archaeon]|nr:hypothetical protein [archaeon]
MKNVYCKKAKLSHSKSLLLLLSTYVSLALFTSLLAVNPTFYGLSTILGTTVLGTTVLGTTVLGTTVLGTTVMGTTSLVGVYGEVLFSGQLAISLLAIGILTYLELSDPSYGKTKRLVEELRRSWLPLSAILVILFMLIVAFRIWAIIA